MTREGDFVIRYLPLLIPGIGPGGGVAAWSCAVSSLALPSLTSVISAWLDLFARWRAGEQRACSPHPHRRRELFLAIVVGAGLGILVAWWRPLNVMLSPLVEVFYPMPKSALIPVTALLARLRRCLQDPADLSRLHAAGDARRL